MACNTSDIDSWKTAAESDASSLGNRMNLQKRITLVDRHVRDTRSDKTLIQVRDSESASEIRYINAAIYTESGDEGRDVAQKCEGEQPENGQTIDAKRRSDCNCPTIALSSAGDAANAVEHTTEHSFSTGQSTYRCYSTSFSDTTLSLESSTGRSAVSSRTITRTERRCKIGSVVANVDHPEALKQDKSLLENRQVVRISATSLSDSTSIGDLASSGSDRRIAHSEWIRRKHEDARRRKKADELAERKRREEEERVARDREEKAQLEKENFVKWVERKRQQELDRKTMLENELELQERLKKIEEKAAVAKTLYLRRWIHKKKEERKARDRNQELREKKVNEERASRLEKSSRAYEKWREESKNRPKPATQGLLPHQTAKPAYVNPIPWQSIVEVNSDEEPESPFDDSKRNIYISRKMSSRKSIAVHH